MKNKVLVIVILLVCICMSGCSLNRKERERIDNIKNDNSLQAKYESEEFHFENLSKDGYGFIKVYYDDRFEVVQLVKNGKDRTIMSFKIDEDNRVWNEPYHMMSINNNFYIEVVYAESFDFESGWQNKNNRLFKINLDTMEVSRVYESNTFELVYDDYTVSDKYVYKAREDEEYIPKYKLIRYNPSNDESVVLTEKLEVDDLFVYDDKLFVKCIILDSNGLEISNKEKIDNNKEEYDYLSMDEDGNNLVAYDKSKFNEYKKKSGLIREGISAESDMYFIKNKKKVTTKDNKVMCDGKEVYKPNKGFYVDLYYSDEENTVGIYTYEVENDSIGKENYYTYNVKTKDLFNVNYNKIYDYTRLLYK